MREIEGVKALGGSGFRHKKTRAESFCSGTVYYDAYEPRIVAFESGDLAHPLEWAVSGCVPARDDYERARVRPDARPVMLMSWRHLLFLHYTVDPEVIQRLLPKGLTVDTFPDAEGVERAWIGIVPFTMCNIRPLGLPALPWIGAFHETNVRTYVHREGDKPGVWFFSLDAARWLACKVARATFGLPYHHAEMSLRVLEGRIDYRSRRHRHRAGLSLSYEIDGSLSSEPGSLEFWLVERYYLYSILRGVLVRGQVHHPPYPLRRATVLDAFETSLSEAVGLPFGPLVHACYSPGVDVEVFAPMRV